ncbi:MAG: hypothetical protein WCC57_12730 [Paracoccaceae bacterium]
MTKRILSGSALLIATLLSGCIEGVGPYTQSPDTVIATAQDGGRDSGVLASGGGAIAYDPDGCQGWILDDGVEGYSGRRFDPVSGLPICNNKYPPGTVLRNYQTNTEGIADYVPRPARVTN